MPDDFLLKTNSLSKDFGNSRGAFEINIEVKPGEVVGFLGPNGAGKTTTLSMLAGLTYASQGSFEMLGKKNINPLNIHQLNSDLGIMLSEVSLEANQNAKSFFIQRSKFYGRESLVKALDLAKKLDLSITTSFRKLSLGNKKKIGLIASEMHSPKLLILDEPTSGLDPLIQQKFLEILNQVKARGGSVLLSSHVLSEVEQICDQIIMIKNGKIVRKDETKKVLEKALKRIRIKGQHPKLEETIKSKSLASSTEQTNTELVIFTDKRLSIMKELVAEGISEVLIEQPNLEEMFLDLYR